MEDHKFDCEEAKWLFGFLIGKGAERPRLTASDRVAIDRPNAINFSIKKIIQNLPKIRHWTIICGDYRDITNQEATWFVDPPYQVGGMLTLSQIDISISSSSGSGAEIGRDK